MDTVLELIIKDSSIIKIFTDGACKGQNGNKKDKPKQTIGAWGYLIKYLGYQTEDVAVCENTTSNREEIKAVINALSILKKFSVPVRVFSDSNLVVNGMSEWIYKWLANGWKTSFGEPVANMDLWIELYNLVCRFDDIEFIHVNGHADCEENNYVDNMCNLAIAEYKKDKRKEKE